ncbi:MAG: hypothetical protein ABJL44_13345 [Algibacter sp.]
MNTANNGGTFDLSVKAGRTMVEVTGQGTIWANEISDAPTWGRLSEFDKMDRFFTDNRDEDGSKINDEEELSDHVSELHTGLKSQMEQGLISANEVEKCLKTAKTDLVKSQESLYDFNSVDEMRSKLDDIDLFNIMSSGGIGYIPVFSYDEGQKTGQQNWKIVLEEIFK